MLYLIYHYSFRSEGKYRSDIYYARTGRLRSGHFLETHCLPSNILRIHICVTMPTGS